MSTELKAPESTDLGLPESTSRAPRPPRSTRGVSTMAMLGWMALGGAVGAGLGFAYYWFVGCNSGTCLIGANPFLSLLFGGLFGLSTAAMIVPSKS